MCAINVNDLFEKNLKEDMSSTKASFFDIDLDIKDNKISTKLYDKQDSFQCLFCMPICNSIIPSKIFYSSIGSEILRLARSTSDRVTLKILVNELLGRVSKQGKQKRDIIILLNEIFGRHFGVSSKIAAVAKGLHILFKLLMRI